MPTASKTGRDNRFFLEPSEGVRPRQHLILAFWLSKYKREKFCCFRPPSLQQFVKVDTENEYTPQIYLQIQCHLYWMPSWLFSSLPPSVPPSISPLASFLPSANSKPHRNAGDPGYPNILEKKKQQQLKTHTS